jgi:hypothetical protein
VAFQADHQGIHPETLGRHEYLQAMSKTAICSFI